MREKSLRAEYLLLTEKSSLKREELLIKLILFGIFVCIAVGFASVFSEEIYFFGVSLGGEVLMLWSLVGLFALTFFYLSLKLYFTGKMYYLSGDCTDSPSSFLRVGMVFRYAVFVFFRSLVKFLWLSLFQTPARFTGLIIIRTFIVTGNMQRVMLYTLITAFLLLTVTGFWFYFYVTGRYFTAELLFIRSPKQNIFEIFKNSALITRESLNEILLFRMRNFLRKGSVFGKMRGVLLVSDLFSDRKFYKSYGVFRPLTFREPF